MWVTVTHIVNPNDFYVCYIAEKKENEALSKKINQHCWREDCCFALDDVLETGMRGFVLLSKYSTFDAALRPTRGPEMSTRRGTNFVPAPIKAQ